MPLLFFLLRLCFAAKLAHATDLTVVDRDISTSGGRMQKILTFILAPIKITFELFFYAFASFVEAFQLQGSKVSGTSVTFMHHLFLILSVTIGRNRNWICWKIPLNMQKKNPPKRIVIQVFAEWYTKGCHSSQLTIWQVKVRAGKMFERTRFVQYRSQPALFIENLLVHLLIEMCRWLSMYNLQWPPMVNSCVDISCIFGSADNSSVFFNIWVGLSNNCRWSMVHLK